MYKEYRRYMNFKKDSFANIKRELEEKFSIRFPTTGLPTEKEKKEYRKLTLPCTKCIIKLQRELRIFMNVPLFQM